MDYQTKNFFNQEGSSVMYLDINSCFATIEQQANPLLRNKPIAIAAYDTPRGCIVAPSIESKKLGVKVGMRVMDAKKIIPSLIVLSPDPDKYRDVHQKIKRILFEYSPLVIPKSIDEFAINLKDTPAFRKGIIKTSQEIKARLKKEIGEYITVSIGIGPNQFLAKTASNLKKPDGLEEINYQNFYQTYQKLNLTDLTGISYKTLIRLNQGGIYSVIDLYEATPAKLHSVFKSIISYHWYLRLRGWEIDDFVNTENKSVGHSYSLPVFTNNLDTLLPILSKLVEKTGHRLREKNFQAGGVSLGLIFANHDYYQKHQISSKSIFSSQDIYQSVYSLLRQAPLKLPVRNIFLSCFKLTSRKNLQLDLFDNTVQKESLVKAVDKINQRWGQFSVIPARMLCTQDIAPDRISFGSVRHLKDF